MTDQRNLYRAPAGTDAASASGIPTTVRVVLGTIALYAMLAALDAGTRALGGDAPLSLAGPILRGAAALGFLLGVARGVLLVRSLLIMIAVFDGLTALRLAVALAEHSAAGGQSGVGGAHLLAVIFPIITGVLIPILLSRPSSRIFFGLRCPSCGLVQGRHVRLFGKTRRCRSCQTVW